MTTDLRIAFPSRPLRVLAHGGSSSWFGYLVGLAFLAGSIAIAVWQVPPLLKDNEIRQNPVVVQDATLRNGKCRTRKAIFTECEADIAYAVDGKRYTAHPDIFFVDFNTEGYRSGVVRSANKPELGTMSIAIDYFWDRVATVLGFVLLLAGIGVAGIWGGVRAARIRRTASGEPVPLQPVPAVITSAEKVRGGTNVNFKADIGGKTRSFVSKFKGGEAPLQVSEDHVLAVVPQGTTTAILLDEGLNRVDLTDEERRRIWSAIHGSAPQPTGQGLAAG